MQNVHELWLGYHTVMCSAYSVAWEHFADVGRWNFPSEISGAIQCFWNAVAKSLKCSISFLANLTKCSLLFRTFTRIVHVMVIGSGLNGHKGLRSYGPGPLKTQWGPQCCWNMVARSPKANMNPLGDLRSQHRWSVWRPMNSLGLQKIFWIETGHTIPHISCLFVLMHKYNADV